MDILVSIIVPCYNQAHFLKESLYSVLEQTYNNWECIIVNDGSPDSTKKVAEEWCAKDDRFRYLDKENGGLSSARNAGIKISKGDYILPLDADDIIDKSFLNKLVPELLKDESLAIITCYSKFFKNNKDNVIHELKPKGSTYKNILFENRIIATSLYRKKCWIQVEGYDEQMKTGFEDWEFWIAITKSGWRYKVVEDFLFYYRKAKHSMLTDTLKNHRISNMEYIFKKHNELYLENHDNTIRYLFFLLKKDKKTDAKLRGSLEYKIAKFIVKPYDLVLKLFKKR